MPDTERKPPKPKDARKMLAALTGDIARADAELDRVHQAAEALHEHHRDRANQARGAIADYRPSHLTAEYLDHVRETARADALANADGVLDHQAAGERLPFAKADDLIPRKIVREDGVVQTYHVRANPDARIVGEISRHWVDMNPLAEADPDDEEEREWAREWLRESPRRLTAIFDGVTALEPILRMRGARDEHLDIDSDRSRASIAKIAASMREHGYQAEHPITVEVNRRGVARIWEGNHRARAAHEAGFTHVPVHVFWEGGGERAYGTYKPDGMPVLDPIAKADQPSLFGPSPLIPVKKTVRRHTGTHVQTFHVRPAEQASMFDPTAHVDARTHDAYDAGGGSTMTEATTEKPEAKHRVRMTSAQYAAAIEQRMDGGEHVDGLKWDGHDLLVDDPAAVSATLTGMANGEDGQAEDSDGDTRKRARGASTVLSNLALKVARLASDAEPEPEPEEPTEPKFEDAGWVIPHSRKEEARRSLGDILGSVKKNGLTRADLADLEAEDPEEANKALTRGAVSAGRLRNLKALGMTAGAAFLTQHIVRRIAPRTPKWSTPKDRQDYFTAVDKVTGMLANARDVEDVMGVLDELNDAATGIGSVMDKSELHRAIVTNVHQLSYRFPNAASITAENLLDVTKQAIYARPSPAMLEAIADVAHAKSREYLYYDLGRNLRTEFSLGHGGARKGYGANRRVIARAQALEAADDWSWAKRTNEDAEGGAWRRRVPAMPERVGPDEAPILDAEGLRTAFGIRGVQYGNYMDGDAAQVHTEAAGTALHDLAAALGIEPEHVSLNGRLSLAFGARGRGGKAAAHYERDTTAINLTKHAGSGTLAHEWGHFLDNILGRLRTGNDPARGAAMLTGIVHTNSRTQDDDPLSPNVVAAFKDLQRAIMRHTEMVPVGGEPYVTKVTDPTAKAPNPNKVSPSKLPRWAPFRFFLKQRDGNVREAWDYAQRYYAQGRPNFPESELKAASITAANLLGEELSVNPRRVLPVENPMLAAARAMGAYWSRPEEMFARAFESFVTDKLAAMDRKNTYLVAGADEDAAAEYGTWAMKKYEPLKKKARGAPKGVIFSPYPTGSQRSAITVAFARLFIALREEGVFAKAIALMDERERVL